MTRPLSELPNREGFEFTGVKLANGEQVACVLRSEYDDDADSITWTIRGVADGCCQTLSGWLPECSTCGGPGFRLIDNVTNEPIKADERTYGARREPCPECGTKDKGDHP